MSKHPDLQNGPLSGGVIEPLIGHQSLDERVLDAGYQPGDVVTRPRWQDVIGEEAGEGHRGHCLNDGDAGDITLLHTHPQDKLRKLVVDGEELGTQERNVGTG